MAAQRERLGALPGNTPVRWVPLDLTLPDDGFEPTHYGLEALWTAVEAISALGLQAMLRGDDAVRDVYQRAAHPHIVGYAAAAGIGALPLVDLLGVPAVQAKLLHSLAALHGRRWDGQMISEFFGLLGAGFGIGYAARTVGRELLKFIPGWGQTVGVVWGATAAGATTYALGKAAGYYFTARRQASSVNAEALRRIYAEALATSTRFLQKPSDHDR